VIWDFDTFDRAEVLSLLAQCVARISQIPKKVLAMYYYENLQVAEIATGLGLTEYEIDQMRAKTLDLLQTVLATQLRHGDFSHLVAVRSHKRRTTRRKRNDAQAS
jgi:DNA-directed RNA polymerase specialized sigma24 family protein